MNTTINKVKNCITNNSMIKSGEKILIAFSGGADSLFLTISLMELAKELNYTICAAHLNHGIRGSEADYDENFVKNFCKKNNIKLYLKKVNIPEISKKLKISEEVAGRNERYRFFNELCKENNINKIAIAHNKNDSVETVIFNMIRGSSLKGLCGIKYVNGNVIRPILDVSRKEIEEYLNGINESYCSDSTNSLNIYSRNKIRNNILESMSDINPSVIDTIYANTASLTYDDDFIDSYCRTLNCISEKNGEIIVNKFIFDKQHIAIKSRLILFAFQKLCGNCNNITARHIDILCKADKSSNIYHMPSGVYAKVSNSSIILTKMFGLKQEYKFDLTPGQSVCTPYADIITLSYVTDIDISDTTSVYIDADLVKSETLAVRNRNIGDRFTPYGMCGEKKLKQYFNELKIPSYDRDKIPIIVDGAEIVAVIPYRISDKYKVTSKTNKIIRIKLTKEEAANAE